MGIKFFCDECGKQIFMNGWGKIYESAHLIFCSEKCKKKNRLEPFMEAIENTLKLMKK